MAKKILYNVNINDSRVEQFETLEDAQEYLANLTKPYITKSVYKYDTECNCWDEEVEYNVNEIINLWK